MKDFNNMNQKERDMFIKNLWEEFSNIALDEEENIDEDFYIWKKGTDRDTIWHWFDDNYSSGLAIGLMELD